MRSQGNDFLLIIWSPGHDHIQARVSDGDPRIGGDEVD